MTKTYFDNLENEAYVSLNLSTCFRPADGKKVNIFGDTHSQTQGYVGVKLTPYCAGSAATCSSLTATTNQNFYNFLSTNQFQIILPNAYYSPAVNSVQITPVKTAVFSIALGSGVNLNVAAPISQTIYLDTL